MMMVDSITGLPSWTSAGTTPFGLISRYSGETCSAFIKLMCRRSCGSFFSASAMRTFCAQTEML